jgi:uncharacterized protein (DUF934 family)
MVEDSEVISVFNDQGQSVELVSVDEWVADIDGHSASEKGVLVVPSDDVELLQGSLSKVTLIVLDFASFDDGRGYSQATLIRKRWGYEGQIIGINAHLDQLQFMIRSGVSSYQLQEQYQGTDESDYAHGYSVCYQAAANNANMKQKF